MRKPRFNPDVVYAIGMHDDISPLPTPITHQAACGECGAIVTVSPDYLGTLYSWDVDVDVRCVDCRPSHDQAPGVSVQ